MVQRIAISNITHRNASLLNGLDILVQNVLHENPIHIKHPTPLQLFPPIVENLVKTDFRDHFSHSGKLIRIYNSKKQVNRNSLFFAFFVNFVQIDVCPVSGSPEPIFNGFMNIVIASASDNEKFGLLYFTNIEINIIHSLTTTEK